jgi:two-component system, LytTR family, sensor kinase
LRKTDASPARIGLEIEPEIGSSCRLPNGRGLLAPVILLAMSDRLKAGLRVFAYFTAIGLLLFGYHYLDRVANREPVSPLEPFINEVLTGAWMAALLFPLVARFARRYPVARRNWITRLPLHIGALVAYSVAHTSLMWLTRSALYPVFGLRSYDYGVMAARYPMEFFHDVIGYTATVSILYLFDHHVRSAQLEATLAQARLKNLQLQLKPHFLFNALNTISSIVYEDPRRADAMIAALSDMLRATITDAETQFVSLDREIEMLERYLDIMRMRFEGGLRVDVHVEPGVGKALVPHLLLQPLVENSIKHGADPQSNAVRVTLRAEREGRRTWVRIRDHGRGLPDGRVCRGIGLSNTAQRLEQLYGAEHTFAFDNCTDGGLVVTVAVPFRT